MQSIKKLLKPIPPFAGLLIALATVAVLSQASGIQTIAYNLIQQAGSPFTKRSTLNFTGAGVTVTDGSGKTNVDIPGSGAAATTFTLTNASSTGTTISKLTKLTGAPSTGVVTSAGDTGGAVGICTADCGTTGDATITYAGSTSCIFDGATTAGHYVQISASVAGDCTDGGGTYPASGQVLGRVLTTNGSGGTFALDLFPSELQAGGGGGGGCTAGVWAALPYGPDWSDFGGGFQVGQYQIDCTGRVWLRGLLAHPLGVPSGSTIATLPAGFRVTTEVLVEGFANDVTPARLNVNPDGTIVCSLCVNGYMSVDQVSFNTQP